MPQPIFLDAMFIALIPLIWGKGAQPLRVNFCQGIERCTHRFAPSSDPIGCSYCCQHMSRISTLPSSRFDESTLLETGEHGLEQHILHLAFDEPGAKLAEHGKIKASIV
jgi:hypothetical protein